MCLFQALRESEKENGDCRNNTTLKMHFFGSRGTGHLTLNQFSKWVSYIISLENNRNKNNNENENNISNNNNNVDDDDDDSNGLLTE